MSVPLATKVRPFSSLDRWRSRMPAVPPPLVRTVLPLAVLALVATGCSGQSAPARRGATGSRAPGSRPPSAGVGSPVSRAAPAERDRPGDPHWKTIRVGAQHDVEGFADDDSVLSGQPVRLYVSTIARRFAIRAYRMGWYRGARARL